MSLGWTRVSSPTANHRGLHVLQIRSSCARLPDSTLSCILVLISLALLPVADVREPSLFLGDPRDIRETVRASLSVCTVVVNEKQFAAEEKKIKKKRPDKKVGVMKARFNQSEGDASHSQ